MRKRIRRIVLLLLLALVIWTVWTNLSPELSSYTVTSSRLPESFDGYRIALVSDLHNTQLGENNKRVLALLQKAQPDMIAITGDLVDSRKPDMDTAVSFIEEAVKIAPCYYVTGNHEARLNSEYRSLKKQLEDMGVAVLEDASTQITLEGASITVLGLQDPSFHGVYNSESIETLVDEQLTQLHTDHNSYTVMLYHRPSYFEVYAKHDVDLVLSGHMHGGQFRIPFLGGLYTPSQGFFPDYDAGLYTDDTTTMLVSRGLGNSVFPIRFNNRPEVLLIELKAE